MSMAFTPAAPAADIAGAAVGAADAGVADAGAALEKVSLAVLRTWAKRPQSVDCRCRPTGAGPQQLPQGCSGQFRCWLLRLARWRRAPIWAPDSVSHSRSPGCLGSPPRQAAQPAQLRPPSMAGPSRP